MLRQQLKNGQTVDFISFNGFVDFSVALQLPITNKHAIAELKKRMDFCAAKNKKIGDVKENPKNFHVTIQLFFPYVNQIKKAAEIFQALVEKYSGQIDVTLTEKNDIFGREGGLRYPVALVESDVLKRLQAEFVEQLTRNNIKHQKAFEFNPHVSLFVTGIPNVQADLFTGLTSSSVKLTSHLELSHKNQANQFVTLTPADLDQLDATIKKAQQVVPAVVAPVVQIDKKAEFLINLEARLKKKACSRNEVLFIFEQLQKRKGCYSFVHEQRHPTWDKIRLLFKAKVKKQYDENPWHTATYQKAVKLLKNAYLEKSANQSVRHDWRADALIDYVRGNSPVHSKMTSTRKLCKK